MKQSAIWAETDDDDNPYDLTIDNYDLPRLLRNCAKEHDPNPKYSDDDWDRTLAPCCEWIDQKKLQDRDGIKKSCLD